MSVQETFKQLQLSLVFLSVSVHCHWVAERQPWHEGLCSWHTQPLLRNYYHCNTLRNTLRNTLCITLCNTLCNPPPCYPGQPGD